MRNEISFQKFITCFTMQNCAGLGFCVQILLEDEIYFIVFKNFITHSYHNIYMNHSSY